VSALGYLAVRKQRRGAGTASDRPAAQPRVVVIGASLAGLLAAAAVSRAGHTVTILERDRLEDTPGPRTGVPQGQQPHVFLLRGLLAAEQLLPGLRSDLEAHGAVPFDSGTLGWLAEQGWAPVRPSGFEIVSLTRPLFEQVVRHRVLDLPAVLLRDTCRGECTSPRWVTREPVADRDRRRRNGCGGSGDRRIRPRVPAAGLAGGQLHHRPANLRGQREDGYATRMYSGAPDCGDVVVYRQTGNRRRHYERLRDRPDRLLAVGDAFVSFNPVFGQGITVAAREALVLRDALAAGLHGASRSDRTSGCPAPTAGRPGASC
jgi:hypothetical protein